MSNISEFYSKMKETSFRRGHEFQITLSGTGVGNLDEDIKFFAQGATLPGKTIGEATVNYQGLSFSLPGNVTFEHGISLTCLCDNNMNIYEDVKAWMNKFSNLAMSTGGDKRLPNTKFYIDLLDSTLSEVVRSYELVGVWPESIGEIALSHEADGAIITFDIGLKYQYFIEAGNGDPLQDGDGGSLLEMASNATNKANKIVNAFK